MAISEITFQLIVESSPNAIVLANREGKIAYVNREMEKLFGYSREDLIGERVELLIPERFRSHHPEYRNSFFDRPTVRAMGVGRELFALRKNGEEFPIEIGLNPVVTVDGTMVIASIIDITERKKAEERFRLVVESAPNAMLLINEEGKILLVNAQAELLFMYSREALIGNKLEMLIPERFRPEHPVHRAGFFSRPQTRAMGAGRDLFALRSDGQEIQVEIGLNPIETPDGTRVLASIIDITERKIREEGARRQVELEAKNRELEQFAYIASHDLLEPLRTVKNYLQVFEEDHIHSFDPVALGYTESMKRAVDRMSTLIRALLDFSRLGQDSKSAAVNCGDLVREVIEDLSTLIHSSQARIEVGNMPTLRLYVPEMRQLFQNLLANSIKFMAKGVAPQIRVLSEEQPGKWLFSVTDNGIGIPSQHFKRIFQIFQRIHRVEEYEGNGIGLANCKKIVELHGGEIWVESEPNRGSTFFFTVGKNL